MINKDMSIMEVIQKYPATLAVFQKHNLGCIGCFAASGESLEQGLTVHGLDVESVVEELNEAAK